MYMPATIKQHYSLCGRRSVSSEEPRMILVLLLVCSHLNPEKDAIRTCQRPGLGTVMQ